MHTKLFFVCLVAGGIFFGAAKQAFGDAAADFERANVLKKVGERQECEQVYKDIIKNYPGTDTALRGWEEIAILNASIGSKFKTAQQARKDGNAAIEKLTTDFSGSALLPTSLCNIAAAYSWAANFKDANDLYQRVIEKYPDKGIVRKARLGIARIRVLSLIKAGNIQAAETETVKLLEDFSGDAELPVTLYAIAKRYRWCKQYQKAKSTFEQVVQQYPDSEYAPKAKVYAGTATILELMHSGDYTAVEQAIDRLLADTGLRDEPELPVALCRVAEVYSDLAFRQVNEGPSSETSARLVKAVRIWERIIEVSPTSDVAPQAYYAAAFCYEYLGQYQQAIGYFTKAVNDWPGYHKACLGQYQIAACYQELAKRGDITNEAAAVQICRACEKLVAEFPGCQLYTSARQLLEKWEKVKTGESTEVLENE